MSQAIVRQSKATEIHWQKPMQEIIGDGSNNNKNSLKLEQKRIYFWQNIKSKNCEKNFKNIICWLVLFVLIILWTCFAISMPLTLPKDIFLLFLVPLNAKSMQTHYKGCFIVTVFLSHIYGYVLGNSGSLKV